MAVVVAQQGRVPTRPRLELLGDQGRAGRRVLVDYLDQMRLRRVVNEQQANLGVKVLPKIHQHAALVVGPTPGGIGQIGKKQLCGQLVPQFARHDLRQGFGARQADFLAEQQLGLQFCRREGRLARRKGRRHARLLKQPEDVFEARLWSAGAKDDFHRVLGVGWSQGYWWYRCKAESTSP